MRPFPLAVVILSACTGSCSEKPREWTSAGDLLARHPDECDWQAGELVPSDAHQWGELGQFGWEAVTSERAGLKFVWSNRDKAYLLLPSGPRAERTLVLTLLAPPSQETLALGIQLNGVPLTTLEVGSEPQEARVHAPLQTWLEGDNLLELSCPTSPTGEGERAIGVGVARVTYDVPRRIETDLEQRRVRLQSGTSVRYRIEPLAAGRVLLAAQAAGPGTLTTTLATVDPATGGERAGEPQHIEIGSAQNLERAFELAPDAGLTEFSVAWEARAGAGDELELRRLEVQEYPAAARPPIILISIDTLSARHLSLYGYPLKTAPALERLARESVVFDQCLTNAPWTLPSFMSLMTGLYANANRLEGSGSELWEHWYLSQNRWTLAEFLRSAGYRTAGFVDNAWITEPFGFPQGFEVYDASAAYNNADKAVAPDGGIRQTTAEARAFLETSAPDRPFFLFVHCFDVHGPYTPPAPYSGRFDGAEQYDRERTALAGGPANVYGIIPTYVARGEVPAGAIPATMHTAPFEGAYDESVQFVDDELGKFFDYLRTKGLLDRAWLIVTADHGETMADSSYYFGHGVLVPDVVHIPLLIRPPGGKPGGARVEQVVQLADLYPTLLELVGSKAERAYLHGRSLVPFLTGGAREPSVVLTEGGPLRQAMLVADGWELLELEPSRDVQVQTLISHPVLTQAWFERAERLGHTRIASQDEVLGRTPAEREENLFGWKKDSALIADFFERMPRTGLTEELLAEMQQRPGFRSLVRFLKSALKEPKYELYDLRKDPQTRNDVSGEFPEKVAELKKLLRREKERRELARKNARPPTQPVDLPREDVDDLRALGYGGEMLEEPEPPAGSEPAHERPKQ